MLRSKSCMMLACGLVIGLSIGGAMTVGVILGTKSQASASLPALEELKLKATASHGAETFAIATGPIDEEVEGLFCLDFLTGDLQCFVINPRTGGLGGWIRTNIVKDLPVEKGKKPSYLLVTGGINARGGSAGNARPAASICYVVDANTGMVAAYTFPWVKGNTAGNITQAAPMKLLYAGKARSEEAIRE